MWVQWNLVIVLSHLQRLTIMILLNTMGIPFYEMGVLFRAYLSVYQPLADISIGGNGSTYRGSKPIFLGPFQ